MDIGIVTSPPKYFARPSVSVLVAFVGALILSAMGSFNIGIQAHDSNVAAYLDKICAKAKSTYFPARG